MKFRCAKLQDAAAIAKLVNLAYRGETSRAGWTTEADILDGLRTTQTEIQQLISSENSLILLCFNEAELLASICMDRLSQVAHIGMFVVQPCQQNNGVGKALLIAAEKLVQEKWQINTLQMHVISMRSELIAFYERRGYQRTGEVSEFPINLAVWQPKVAGLQLITLEKHADIQQATR